jgi:hypothetical protein
MVPDGSDIGGDLYLKNKKRRGGLESRCYPPDYFGPQLCGNSKQRGEKSEERNLTLVSFFSLMIPMI